MALNKVANEVCNNVRTKKLIFSLLVGSFLFSQPKALALICLPHLLFPPRMVAALLGWTPTSTNLCGGYYQEPDIVLACSNPAEIDAATTTITADKTVSFSANGTSALEGNIIVTQPGRKITADKILLYRDPTTKDISQMLLNGNVNYFEAGKQLVAESVYVDLQQKYVKLTNTLYRLAKKTRCQVLNAWGQAQCVVRRSNSDILLTNASYTTCPPLSQTWKIIASQIHIDRDRGWGKTINTYLYIHNVPVIWIPYFSFPIDKKRKTGFLFPTVGYSNNNGLFISQPYYLNLAPNYDATLIPSYIFRRGIQLDTKFRFLTCHSNGYVNVEFLPYDNLFARFRHNAANVYGVTPDTMPFLERINHDSNSRGLLSFSDCTVFNPHWWGSLNLNYVTDDYYLQDFAYNPFSSSKDQLLNQAEINYGSTNWRFLGRIQTYQTLHPINQQPILNQYSRLPQLYLSSDYPDYPFNFNYQLNTGLVYFNYPRDFVTGQPTVSGERFHFQPSVDYPLIYPASYIIPKLKLDVSVYNLQDVPAGQPKQITRVLPILSLDSGLFLERCLAGYLQTLEPRLFYLFVPYQNQNDIPLFDTTLPSFGYEQLYRNNRFVGFDRLGDANQLSFSLTTRLLNDQTGEQKLRASIGQILYFSPPKVCLLPDCTNDFYAGNVISPLVSEVSYCFNTAWNGVASVAINPVDRGLNNASIQLHYRPDANHIFNIGYDFVLKGDTLTTYELNSSESNLSRINAALAWQLSEHWQALGNINYNLSHGHPQAYFYGFQYNSCCWALRIIASRLMTAENLNDITTYQTNFYVQLQLKGLGNIGNSNPGNLLTTSIFGYQDTFRG